MACDAPPLHRSCRVPHYRETDRVQVEEVRYHQRRHIAADSSRTVLAPRNKHRTVPRARLQSHSYFTFHKSNTISRTNDIPPTAKEREKKRKNPKANTLVRKRKKHIYRRPAKDEPLPTAYCTTAAMFLLFLHLAQDSIFFDLDEITPFLLSKPKPKFFNTFPLLNRTSTPYLVSFRRCRRGIRSWWSRFMRSGSVGRRRGWVWVRVIMRVCMRW